MIHYQCQPHSTPFEQGNRHPTTPTQLPPYLSETTIAAPTMTDTMMNQKISPKAATKTALAENNPDKTVHLAA